MNRTRHLTDEALMLHAGKRLSPPEDAAVVEHLQSCASCRLRFSGTHLAHTVLTNLSDMGLHEIEQRSRPRSEPARPAHHAFPLLPIGSIAAIAMLVVVLLFSPRVVTEVRASELLAKASAGELAPSETRGYRLQIGDIACATLHHGTRTVAAGASSSCTRALAHLSRTVWEGGSPLSARTFNTWRKSLPRHRDHIDHIEKGWRINTSSDTGAIRTASLELREADLHPVGLVLSFDDTEELHISESENVTESQPATLAASSAPALHSTGPLDDPSDVLEVKAWQMLHERHADSGWEANVLRTGGQVSVLAAAANEARKQELQHSLDALAGVHVKIATPDEISGPVDFLPQRTFSGAGPALAEPWLLEHFHDPIARNAYKNDVVRLSRDLLGKALLIDHLEKRRATMTNCSCANDLSRLIFSEQAELHAQQATLLTAVAPLADALPNTAIEKPLSAKDARALDLIVQQFLISTDEPLETLDQHKASLRDLLGASKDSSALAEEKSTLHQ